MEDRERMDINGAEDHGEGPQESTLTNNPSEAEIIAVTSKQNKQVSVFERTTSSADSKSTQRSGKPWMAVLSSFVKWSANDHHDSNSGSRPWKPSLMQFGPLSGVFCMALAIASITASLGILAGSNYQPTANWSTPPSTYLAICTAIANLSMRYACIQGVVITWWSRALKGSSVQKLHHDWRAGTTIRGALTSGRNIGLLGLACVASTFVLVDGPLLQRSSTVISKAIDRPVPLNINMAPQIPTGFTGIWETAKALNFPDNWSTVFNKTIPAPHGEISNDIWCAMKHKIEGPLSKKWMFTDAPLEDVILGCPDKCKAKLIAPAVAVTACSSHQLPFNGNMDVQWKEGEIAVALEQQEFFLSTALDVGGEIEKINMVTGYATLSDCKGTIYYTTCSLQSAIGEYNVTIDKHLTTLDEDSVGHPKILALSNNAPVDHSPGDIGQHYSTLAGIVYMMWSKWDTWYGAWKLDGRQVGAEVGFAWTSFERDDSNGTCPSFFDPQPAMLAQLNRLMVYTGQSATGKDAAYLESRMEPRWATSVQTTTIGQQTGHHNVYETNFWFFLGAALVEVVCVALIAPTYWGRWKLGRPMSFSPLELAKAFKSPLLEDCDSNSSGRDIAKTLGKKDLKYGATTTGSDNKLSLAFANSGSVYWPARGAHFES